MVLILNIGVLACTRATDLQAVIDAIDAGKLKSRISVVISDKKDAYALERARMHGIGMVFIDPKSKDIISIADKDKKREAFDRKVAAGLEKRKVGLILAIGYMRILSPWFVNKYKNKIMNIHPSLLPDFAGGMDKNVYEEVLKAGVKETGCTLHFIDERVDNGPIIMQKKVKIEKNETADSLKEKVQKAEQEVIVKALELYERGRISVKGNKVVVSQ